MSRIIRCSLIQTTSIAHEGKSLAEIKQAMIDKHVPLVRQAAADGSQIVCLQELFYGPYFCAEQSTRWYDLAEPVPDGPTIRLMQGLAKELQVAIIVPIYEMEATGVYYNTAAVIDNQGRYLGKYRKSHLPHLAPRLLGEVLLSSGQSRISRLRSGLLQNWRLSLLRPSFSRGRTRTGPEWC